MRLRSSHCFRPFSQVYYEVPDQMIIINHALLMFSFQAKAVLFMGDIDEFFVPQASTHTLETHQRR